MTAASSFESQESLWADDGAARRQRIAEALVHYDEDAKVDAARVWYLPASVPWHVSSRTHADAVYAVEVAARALGLSFVPTVEWFRLAGPQDHPDTDGTGWRDDPGVLGAVFPAAPRTILLNAVFGHALAGSIRPSLQAVVAHEAQHVADLVARSQTRGSGLPAAVHRRLLEARADLTAAALVRDAPAPFRN